MTLAAATVVNNFYLSPSGDHFNFVRVSDDDVIGTEARRVSQKLLVKQPSTPAPEGASAVGGRSVYPCPR
jgi:hypothetical protein